MKTKSEQYKKKVLSAISKLAKKGKRSNLNYIRVETSLSYPIIERTIEELILEKKVKCEIVGKLKTFWI